MVAFAGYIYEYIFWNENLFKIIENTPKFVPNGQIENYSEWFLALDWHTWHSYFPPYDITWP